MTGVQTCALPIFNKRDSKYVDGAEPGMIFNTVTGQAYDGEKGVNVDRKSVV